MLFHKGIAIITIDKEAHKFIQVAAAGLINGIKGSDSCVMEIKEWLGFFGR
jgi:hypothetical protein